VSLGLDCQYSAHKGRYGGQWWCEGERLPGYTERNRMLEAAMFTPCAYSIYSAALHAEWQAVTGSWQEIILANGTKAIVTRPDRVAIWGAVLIAAAPAVWQRHQRLRCGRDSRTWSPSVPILAVKCPRTLPLFCIAEAVIYQWLPPQIMVILLC
jgi:hypothetical protein